MKRRIILDFQRSRTGFDQNYLDFAFENYVCIEMNLVTIKI